VRDAKPGAIQFYPSGRVDSPRDDPASEIAIFRGASLVVKGDKAA
jgi:hypothetical protein